MAARGLGVGESTLGRWEDRSLVPIGDLPGEVQRLRSEDVAALEAQAVSDFPAIVEEELPTVCVENVDC